MRSLVFKLFLFLVSGVCYAQPYFYEDGAYKFEASSIEECYGLGTSNPLLSVCQKHFKNMSKNELDLSYNKLLSKLNRDKKELVYAQKKWGEFSIVQCQFEAKASEVYSKPYNAYSEIFNKCIYKLRLERARYLNQIDTGCAGCVQ